MQATHFCCATSSKLRMFSLEVIDEKNMLTRANKHNKIYCGFHLAVGLQLLSIETPDHYWNEYIFKANKLHLWTRESIAQNFTPNEKFLGQDREMSMK